MLSLRDSQKSRHDPILEVYRPCLYFRGCWSRGTLSAFPLPTVGGYGLSEPVLSGQPALRALPEWG